jgi:hypothetical protein
MWIAGGLEVVDGRDFVMAILNSVVWCESAKTKPRDREFRSRLGLRALIDGNA